MSKNDNVLSAKELLDEVYDSVLYPQFLAQLQKDIHRAGINYTITKNEPWDIFIELEQLIACRLQSSEGFHEYVNLLYAVDVSEYQIRNLQSDKSNDIATYAAFLILKREWQKVCFRNQF